MCESLLLLAFVMIMLSSWVPVMQMVRFVQGKPHRVLFQSLVVYMRYVLIIVVVFLGFSDPCFWGFVQNWVVVTKGLLVGILPGLALGIIGVRYNIAPHIHDGVLNETNKGGFIVGLIRFGIVGAFLFVFMYESNTSLCQMFDIQGETLCRKYFQGILIGYFLGILFFECAWIRLWEIRNHRFLYVEGMKESPSG